MPKHNQHIRSLRIKFFTLSFFIVISSISADSFSQNLQDTTVEISEVKINADRIFEKEIAGVKETNIDTFILNNKNNLSLSDILSENTSIYIKHYGRGALATASFRGTAATHTQVTWNGLNINSPMLGMVDFSLIPVNIIDELKLQYGAASVSNQSGGLGGHISIKNKTDWERRIGGKVYQSFGSFSTFESFGQIKFGNKKFQSSTRIYRSSSENDYTFTNKNIIENPKQKNLNADYMKCGFLQEIYYRLNNKWIISSIFWHQNAGRSIPSVLSYEGYSFDQNNSETDEKLQSKINRQEDKTHKGIVEAIRYGEKSKMSFRSGIDYQTLRYYLIYKLNTSEAQKAVDSYSNMLNFYTNFSADINVHKRFKTLFNVQYNYYNISTIDNVIFTGYEKKRNDFSLFYNNSININKHLNLSLKIRKDIIEEIKSPLIFNFGISYKPFEKKDLIVKANAGRNFHNPSLNDMYWQPGGNPDLLPETGHSLESGIHFMYKSTNTIFETELTGYYNSINDWILWLPGLKGYWQPFNIKEVKSFGIEFFLKVTKQFGKTSIDILGNYAITRSENREESLFEIDNSIGQQLPYIPVHSGNSLLSFSRKGLYLNYQYTYEGVINLLNSNIEVITDDSEINNKHPFFRLYAQHLNHLAIGKMLKFKGVTFNIELKVNNLFNEEYRNVLNRYMPKRNYSIILKLSF